MIGPPHRKRAMAHTTRATNTLRIIGGQWRSRKLEFPDVEGLRPTPDRVRETLFNWLTPVIGGARCLDLFAGSGALGFEALSRGAAEVIMVENSALAARILRENLTKLNAQGTQIVERDALDFLRQGRGDHAPFDIVFIDPPYHQNLVNPCCAILDQAQWISAHAYLFIEAEASLQKFSLPAGFECTRSKQAGQVGYHLAVRHQPS